jgi:hypothetical protein
MLVFINLMLQDINLPDAKPGEVDASMRRLCKLDHEFDNFFRSAPYFLEEKAQFKGMDSIQLL